YGGSAKQIFLAGHSAGGHLAALVATDECYLKAHGMGTADLKGVIAFSGVYKIPPGNLRVTLGGIGPNAFHVDQVAPLRGDGDAGCAACRSLIGIPTTVNVFGPAFG